VSDSSYLVIMSQPYSLSYKGLPVTDSHIYYPIHLAIHTYLALLNHPNISPCR